MLRRNVLIFHNAALGDFLLTWPVAMALGRVLAQSRVFYVAGQQKGQLAERLIGIEAVDAEAGWHHLHRDDEDAKLPEPASRMVQNAQMAVVFSQQRDERFIENLKRASKVDLPVLHLIPNPGPGKHVWRHQLDQLTGSPMLRGAVEQMQHLIEDQGVVGVHAASDGRRVVIHPGSGAERKNWPIGKVVEVATILRSRGMDVTFTLGEVEREKFGAKVRDELNRVGDLCLCDTARSLLDAISSGCAYLGNDSGPTHLAAMIGKPTVAMFGPTSDAVAWKPMGPRVCVMPFDASASDVADRLATSKKK
jgi:heptosyltransferase III